MKWRQQQQMVHLQITTNIWTTRKTANNAKKLEAFIKSSNKEIESSYEVYVLLWNTGQQQAEKSFICNPQTCQNINNKQSLSTPDTELPTCSKTFNVNAQYSNNDSVLSAD